MERNELIKKLQGNKKLLLLGALALVIFHQYIVFIILFIIFGVMGILSLKVTRVVPHISVETITASSILFGYVWGWKLGLAFGIIFGLIGYTSISLIKLTTILNALFMGLTGLFAALFASLGYNFFWAFLISFSIRATLGFIVFSTINPDVFENVLHSFGDGAFNVLIVYQLMSVIYELILPFA